MPADVEQATERTKLLYQVANDRRLSTVLDEDAHSVISTHVSKAEQALGNTPVGERLPYNDYTTIDWLHDLASSRPYNIHTNTADVRKVKDSFRARSIRSRGGIRGRLTSSFESCQGWIAAALIGVLTACVAFLVDVAEATVSDWKLGYCTTNVLSHRESCCTDRQPLRTFRANLGEDCEAWHMWTDGWYRSFGIYVGFALAFGIISSSITMLTKRTLPATAPGHGDRHRDPVVGGDQGVTGKSMYMAAGSGIPEIKTILSGCKAILSERFWSPLVALHEFCDMSRQHLLWRHTWYFESLSTRRDADSEVV